MDTSAGFCYYKPRKKTISSESVLLQAKYRIALKILRKNMDRNKHQWIIFIQCQNPKIKSYQRSDHPNSLTKNVITTLAIDNKKRLWWELMGKDFVDIMMKQKLFTKIISNLLSNALKYAKSTIRITTTEKDSEIDSHRNR